MISDETLMAYLDGELDAAQRSEVEQALDRDAAVQLRLAQHRAAAEHVRLALDTVMREPVPEQLLRTIEGRVNVIRLPSRPKPRGLWWSGAAVAASLAVGVMVGRSLEAEALVGPGLAAAPPLTAALNQQFSGQKGRLAEVGLSFRSSEGRFCRTFVARSRGTAGLACRSGDGWRVRMMVPTAAESQAEYRMAASALPAPVAQLAQSLAAGPAYSHAEERAAIVNKWH